MTGVLKKHRSLFSKDSVFCVSFFEILVCNHKKKKKEKKRIFWFPVANKNFKKLFSKKNLVAASFPLS